MTQHFRDNTGKQYNYKEVSGVLNIKDTKTRDEIIKILNRLTIEKILSSPSKGKYTLVKASKDYYQGTLDVTSTGRGFVICEDLEHDIMISKSNINRAFQGDLVEVYVYKRKQKSGAFEGEIVTILERKKTQFVGVLQIEKNYAFVLTRGPRMYTDFFIDKKQLHGYTNGDKVLVEYTDWPKRADSPYGTLIESFGPPGETNTEMHAILSDYGLPLHFPDEVEAAANAIDQSIRPEEIKKRRDFRDTLTFTIDPKTAKDFDDALSFKILGKDRFEIGIHIADVSHYVQPNSVLDQEAYDRATSVYLVDRVVPMLPEILSNGVCSLRPHEEKYTFSAVFTMNSKGEVLEEWFGKTVIYSDQRFAYEEAQELIETQAAQVSKEISLTGASYTVSNDLLKGVLTLDEIAKKLRKKRMKNGALSFDRVEVNFILKEDDTPESVYFKTSKDANKLVEEFMLLANKQVASFAGNRKTPLPFVYRIHDEPDVDKLNNLQMVVSNFGYKLDLKTKDVSKSLNVLLSDIQGKQEQNLIDTLTIRCMSKAEYNVDNIGHYGLAFNFYSHFTSPIRRYPDVMVHRLLEHHLEKQKVKDPDSIQAACVHSSQRELIATKAERDSIKFMQIKFMEDKVGKTFEGVISGVTDRGIYVELVENKCEGMIRIKDITGDYFNYDDKAHALVGERTKKRYQLGDSIDVSVLKADLIKRHLDFKLEEK
ncbi:MAG: ribonuclease R [Flavobacteriaceae bacterium]|nr:ribonuclease R [Flavobacteriaceae bacterium]